jgi:aromatic ring-opening dioxygenase LigB subunit
MILSNIKPMKQVFRLANGKEYIKLVSENFKDGDFSLLLEIKSQQVIREQNNNSVELVINCQGLKVY